MLELRIKKIISRLFGIPEDMINHTTSTETVTKWNSLGHMNLIIALEEEFSVNFSAEQMMEMLSFTSIVSAVNDSLKQEA